VSPRALKRACLSLRGAQETFPFSEGLSVFKVGGKIFAMTVLEAEPPLRLSLRCEPEIAVELRAAHPAIAPGYHLNKRHWNTLTLDGSLPDKLVRELIEDSYDLVVESLTRRQRLGLIGR
jgi:predicted DNA-binding protein (MmcQ/YjbR family)